MKALLKKDIFCVLKSMKVFLLVIVLFAAIPGFSASRFAIIYAAMLPLTALAYDERSKWDVLAATMPYSPLQIVLSKYVLMFDMLAGRLELFPVLLCLYPSTWKKF